MELKKVTSAEAFKPHRNLGIIEESDYPEESDNEEYEQFDEFELIQDKKTGKEFIIQKDNINKARKKIKSNSLYLYKNNKTKNLSLQQTSMNKSQNKINYFKRGNPNNECEILRELSQFYKVEKSTIIKNEDLIHDDLIHPKTQDIFQMKKGPSIFKYNKIQIHKFKFYILIILQFINIIIRYTLIQFPFCIKTLGLVY
jgi:hypothetical protein